MTLGVLDGYFSSTPASYDHKYYCESNNIEYEFNVTKAEKFIINISDIDGYGFIYNNQEILDYKYLIEFHVVNSRFNGGHFKIKDTKINETFILSRNFKRYLYKFIKNISFA